MIPKEVQDRINYHREALNKSESERTRLENTDVVPEEKTQRR